MNNTFNILTETIEFLDKEFKGCKDTNTTRRMELSNLIKKLAKEAKRIDKEWLNEINSW
jgi:uncharacterized protein Yka (UPF0111/DUF47 family)